MGELFDYVMQTPGNTNPAVLSSEIQKLIDENFVQPDWNQNKRTEKDYIKNRPFYLQSYGLNEEWVDILSPTTGTVILISDLFQNLSSNILQKNYSYEATVAFPPTASPLFLNSEIRVKNKDSSSLSTGRLNIATSGIRKIDAINYKNTTYPQGDIYFILDPDKLGEDNKVIFPNKGIYLIRSNNSNFSNYDLYRWKITMGGAVTIDPKLLPDNTQGKIISDPDNHFTEKTVEGALNQIGDQLSSKELILDSSTADSTKKFKITVDDTGTITATEINET